MSNNTTTNYNNNDTRCGLLMEVRVNCNYITSLYCDYNSEGSWELTFIGKNRGCETDEEYEERCMEAFWGEYNKSIVHILEEPHKFREGEMEYELIERFEYCLHDWRDNIIMRNLCEDESDSEEESEEEEEEEEFRGCKMGKCDANGKCNMEQCAYESEEEEDEEEALGHTCELCMDIAEKEEVEEGGEWLFDKKGGVWLCGDCSNSSVNSEINVEEIDLDELAQLED